MIAIPHAQVRKKMKNGMFEIQFNGILANKEKLPNFHNVLYLHSLEKVRLNC